MDDAVARPDPHLRPDGLWQHDPGDVPWRDWYLAWFPPRPEPSGFQKWKLSSTGANVVRAYWHEREVVRLEHVLRYGAAGDDWPRGLHTDVTLYRPALWHGACLGCTWVDVRGSETQWPALQAAAKHRLLAQL